MVWTSLESKKVVFYVRIIHTHKTTFSVFLIQLLGPSLAQNQLFLIPISASFSLLKWSVSFYRTDHFVYKKFTIRAIKKGPIPRNFFEKSAQNDEGGGSCPVTNP